MRAILGMALLCILAAAAFDIQIWSSEHALSRGLKFAGICLTAAAAFVLRGQYDRQDIFRLRAGLLLSVVADFLIGILQMFMAGLAVFALVHLVYSWRHLRRPAAPKKELLLGAAVAAFGAFVMWISSELMQAAGLLTASLVYAVPLAFSLYAGLGVLMRDFYSGHARWMAALGSALFFAVDVMVAHYNAMPEGNERTGLGIVVWPLYLPAQIVLCLSAGCRAVPRGAG